MSRYYYQITAPHFCAGIAINMPADVVTVAAPILNYMRGWSLARVVAYCGEKGWVIAMI